MDVLRSMNTMNKILSFACLRESIKTKVKHNLRQSIGILERGGSSEEKWFEMKYLVALQDCVNVVIANHELHHFLKKFVVNSCASI